MDNNNTNNNSTNNTTNNIADNSNDTNYNNDRNTLTLNPIDNNNPRKTKDLPKIIYNYKIVMIGDSNVGKTHLFDIYNSIDYLKEITVVANYKIKKIKIIENDIEKILKINIWDIAGSDSFKNIVKSYYVGSDGLIFVFDLTNKRSFLNIHNWVTEIGENIDLNSVKKILIGNKCDLNNIKVSNRDIDEMVGLYGFSYFETSNNVKISIDTAFNYIINEIVAENVKSCDNSFVLKNDFEKNNGKNDFEKCCVIS